MMVQHRLAATFCTFALIAPAAVWSAAPAQAAEVDRIGPCGNGSYDFYADPDGRIEVGLSLEGVGAFTNWNVVLRQDGRRFYNKTVRVDEDGDRDIVQFRQNAPGPEVFKFRAKKADGSTVCKARIILR